MIKIDFSEINGRGVFATQNIEIGTELICEVMIFENDIECLKKWSYPWSKTHFSFCVGFGSFFNHSDNPNIKIKSIDKVNLTKTFVITKQVNEGDELLLYYNETFNK